MTNIFNVGGAKIGVQVIPNPEKPDSFPPISSKSPSASQVKYGVHYLEPTICMRGVALHLFVTGCTIFL